MYFTKLILLHSQVSFSRTRYHECIKRREWQDRVCTDKRSENSDFCHACFSIARYTHVGVILSVCSSVCQHSAKYLQWGLWGEASGREKGGREKGERGERKGREREKRERRTGRGREEGREKRGREKDTPCTPIYPSILRCSVHIWYAYSADCVLQHERNSFGLDLDLLSWQAFF